MLDSFGTRATLDVAGKTYHYRNLQVLEDQYRVSRLPYSLRVLLENLLRHGAEGWDVERQRTAWANLTATAWAML